VAYSAGIQLGQRFYNSLKQVTEPWRVLKVGRICLLAFALFTAIFISHTSLIMSAFIATCFTIGLWSTMRGAGKTIDTNASLATAAAAPALLTGLAGLANTVLMLVIAPGHWMCAVSLLLGTTSIALLVLSGAVVGTWLDSPAPPEPDQHEHDPWPLEIPLEESLQTQTVRVSSPA